MITCPKCNHSLPDWSQSCQFCNTDVRAIARPAGPAGKPQYTSPSVPKWIWPAYYIVSAYFVLSGLYTVISGVFMMANRQNNAAGEVMGTVSVVMMIIGGITALIASV